jgi:hypothetical protein
MTKCCINITPLNVSRETLQFRMILICNQPQVVLGGATNIYKLAKNNLIELVDITNLICIMSLMINLKILKIILVNLKKVTT